MKKKEVQKNSEQGKATEVRKAELIRWYKEQTSVTITWEELLEEARWAQGAAKVFLARRAGRKSGIPE